MAEKLGRRVEEIEAMDSDRFEEWREFYFIKAELEKEAMEEARQGTEDKTKGTMRWHYDS